MKNIVLVMMASFMAASVSFAGTPKNASGNCPNQSNCTCTKSSAKKNMSCMKDGKCKKNAVCTCK